MLSRLLPLCLFVWATVVHAKPCTTKDLSVFTGVSGHVAQCRQASNVTFQIPPTTSLAKSQAITLCKTRACLEMIGAVDDLDVPTCEQVYDERNMTLQSSLDRFVSVCDVTTPAPSPMKKRRKSLEKATDSSASYGGQRRFMNDAKTERFVPTLVLCVALGMAGLLV